MVEKKEESRGTTGSLVVPCYDLDGTATTNAEP